MKKNLFIVLALFLSVSVFASDWYICMGSFKNLDKAKQRVGVLAEAGFSVFINEVEKADSSNLYRVLYSEKFTKKEDAKFRRNELLALSKIKELGLSDIWYCESNGIKYAEPVVQEEVVVEAPAPVVQQVQVPSEPQKQTVIVKINNIEEQRFDITSDDRLIRVNINLDEQNVPLSPVVDSTPEAAEEEPETPAIQIVSAEEMTEQTVEAEIDSEEVEEPAAVEEESVEVTEAETVEVAEVPAEEYVELIPADPFVEAEGEAEEAIDVTVEEEIPAAPFVEEGVEEIPAEPYVEDETEDLVVNEK